MAFFDLSAGKQSLDNFPTSIINFETPNIRHFYEQNQNTLIESTPRTEKIKFRLITTPSSNTRKNSIPTVKNLKKDLFSELLGSENKFQISPYNHRFSSRKKANLNTPSFEQNLMNFNQIQQQQQQQQLLQQQHQQQQAQKVQLQSQREQSQQSQRDNNNNNQNAQYKTQVKPQSQQIIDDASTNDKREQISNEQSKYFNTPINNTEARGLLGLMHQSSMHSMQDDNNSGEVRKRKRKNNQQLLILKNEFEKGGYWNKEKILNVAKTTGLSESQVYKWCWDQKKKRIENFRKCMQKNGRSPKLDYLKGFEKENYMPPEDEALYESLVNDFQMKAQQQLMLQQQQEQSEANDGCKIHKQEHIEEEIQINCHFNNENIPTDYDKENQSIKEEYMDKENMRPQDENNRSSKKDKFVAKLNSSKQIQKQKTKLVGLGGIGGPKPLQNITNKILNQHNNNPSNGYISMWGNSIDANVSKRLHFK